MRDGRACKIAQRHALREKSRRQSCSTHREKKNQNMKDLRVVTKTNLDVLFPLAESFPIPWGMAAGLFPASAPPRRAPCSCQHWSHWGGSVASSEQKWLSTHSKRRDRKGDAGQAGSECKHRARGGTSAGLRSALLRQRAGVCLTSFSAGEGARGTQRNQIVFPPPSSLTQPRIICLHCKFFIQLSHAAMFFSTQFFREWRPTT